MATCCDTSFLYSLYGHDAHSQRAVTELQKLPGAITISPFNEFELANALHHAAWRGLLASEECGQRLAHFAQDQELGAFQLVPCDLPAIMSIGRRISHQRTTREGHRSFDILHVAAALHLRAELFLTFDARQRALAEAEGLRGAI